MYRLQIAMICIVSHITCIFFSFIDVKSPFRTRYINLGPVVEQEDKIWTLEVNHDKHDTPIVLLHGFGSGVGLWCMNVDKISNDRRPLYAIDLLGFGRSSRPKFSTDPEKIEQQYITSIEKWRSEIKLEKFVLLGHSFGGYLATAYSIQYPERYDNIQVYWYDQNLFTILLK